MLNIFEDSGVTLTLVDGLLKVEGLKQLPPGQAQQIREKIKTHRTEIMRELSKIPSPSPPGHEYADLWNKAWILADFVDGDTAPLEARKARLPELLMLRDRMAEIERQAVPTARPDPETSPADTWHTWESGTTTTPDTCPAQCRRSGKCYAAAYFEGKPGKAKDCEPDGCDRYPGTLLPRQFLKNKTDTSSIKNFMPVQNF